MIDRSDMMGPYDEQVDGREASWHSREYHVPVPFGHHVYHLLANRRSFQRLLLWVDQSNPLCCWRCAGRFGGRFSLFLKGLGWP